MARDYPNTPETAKLGPKLDVAGLVFAAYALLLAACSGDGGDVDSPPPVYFRVDVSLTGAGTASPKTQQVQQGTTASISLLADSGQRIGAASGCGGTLNNATYTTAPIYSNCTVKVELIADTVVFDCSGANCSEILLFHDPAATMPGGMPSPFRGYADASVRKDPTTGEFWMAYSWPHLNSYFDVGSQQYYQVAGVDIHLAHSFNGGANGSWQSGIAGNALWAAHPATDLGASGVSGYTDYEVANLLPVKNADNSVTWYGVRLAYFVTPKDNPLGGKFDCFTPDGCERPNDSFRLEISRADSPPELANAESAVLGGAITSANWGVNTNLAALPEADSSNLDKCMWWNEPALYHEGATLYLVARCMAFAGPLPDLSEFDLMVFATEPEGKAVGEWAWRHVGRLTDAQDASALGGEGLTQADIMIGSQGQLLMIVTPDSWNSGFVHHNCQAVELESIDPPIIKRDRGEIRVWSLITASDQSGLGNGSCTYEAASSAGIVMAKRVFDDPQAALVSALYQTGIMP